MNIMKQQETTLVQRACAKVAGFKALHKRLEKKIIVSGKSLSTLNNYMRCIAHLSLCFKCLPTDLDLEQIEEYLLSVKKENKTPSESFFKHTVYGLRFLFRCEGLDDRAIRLPHLKRDSKLPVVLGRSEMMTCSKRPYSSNIGCSSAYSMVAVFVARRPVPYSSRILTSNET